MGEIRLSLFEQHTEKWYLLSTGKVTKNIPQLYLKFPAPETGPRDIVIPDIPIFEIEVKKRVVQPEDELLDAIAESLQQCKLFIDSLSFNTHKRLRTVILPRTLPYNKESHWKYRCKTLMNCFNGGERPDVPEEILSKVTELFNYLCEKNRFERAFKVARVIHALTGSNANPYTPLIQAANVEGLLERAGEFQGDELKERLESIAELFTYSHRFYRKVNADDPFATEQVNEVERSMHALAFSLCTPQKKQYEVGLGILNHLVIMQISRGADKQAAETRAQVKLIEMEASGELQSLSQDCATQ
jgi:hypothetical protein